MQRLDNETSIPLEAFIRKLDISIQYCPPSQHRTLRAERAIRTFKNHAISTFCTTSKLFPTVIWDLLLPQILLCLNHLTPFAPNPAVSAYAGIHGGQHDFRAHPIAPAGTRILIHDKPANRISWAPHGVPGFYIGSAHKHYRCYTVWATPTNSVRITYTVAWLPEQSPLPHLTPSDAIIAAIKDLSTTIATYAAVKPSFMLPIIDPILHELRTLAQMYQSATPITSLDHQHASPAKDSDDNIRSTSQTSRTASLPRVEPVSDTAMPMAAQPLALATLNLIEDGRPLTSALTKKSAFKKSGKKQKMRKLRAYSHHTQYGLFILKTNLLIAASTQYTTTLNRKKSAMLPASSHIASVAPSGETVSIILAPSRPAQPISMSSRSCSTRCLRTTQIG